MINCSGLRSFALLHGFEGFGPGQTSIRDVEDLCLHMRLKSRFSSLRFFSALHRYFTV